MTKRLQAFLSLTNNTQKKKHKETVEDVKNAINVETDFWNRLCSALNEQSLGFDLHLQENVDVVIKKVLDDTEPFLLQIGGHFFRNGYPFKVWFLHICHNRQWVIRSNERPNHLLHPNYLRYILTIFTDKIRTDIIQCISLDYIPNHFEYKVYFFLYHITSTIYSFDECVYIYENIQNIMYV
jgi:hypothetical protein